MRPQPSCNRHQDGRPTDRGASSSNPMLPGHVAVDEQDEADERHGGGQEEKKAARPSLQEFSAATRSPLH